MSLLCVTLPIELAVFYYSHVAIVIVKPALEGLPVQAGHVAIVSVTPALEGIVDRAGSGSAEMGAPCFPSAPRDPNKVAPRGRSSNSRDSQCSRGHRLGRVACVDQTDGLFLPSPPLLSSCEELLPQPIPSTSSIKNIADMGEL